MNTPGNFIVATVCAVLLGACGPQAEDAAIVYESVPVQYRTIDISVEAAGIIEPETAVEVKSKASGEILKLGADIGDYITEGTLLVQIDKRTPRNNVDQSGADLQAARARRQIADTQLQRTRNLLEKGIVTEIEHEQALLELANAEALVISRQVDLENARIALGDTDVMAPISGIIIEKNVERGQVISSPIQDVGGGTVLLRMADLDTVRVRTLVDETDIGKILPGMPVRVVVAAYPNQPFTGEVMKIEPQAVIEQNVTMFPVLVRLENPQGLLRPGMNAEVRINIARAENVLAVPTMALRTDRDIAATAGLLGITDTELEKLLGDSPHGRFIGGSLRIGSDSRQAGNADMSTRSAEDNGLVDYRFGGDYWVLVVVNDHLEPRRVVTGVTDLDYSEILNGLSHHEQVLLLPSSGLIERQERIQGYLNRRMSLPGTRDSS